MLIISTKTPERSYILYVFYVELALRGDILKVYLTTIRPVLEYAVPKWQVLPA